MNYKEQSAQNDIFENENPAEQEWESIFRENVNEFLQAESAEQIYEMIVEFNDQISKFPQSGISFDFISNLPFIERLLGFLNENEDFAEQVLKLIYQLISKDPSFVEKLENNDHFLPFLFECTHPECPFAFRCIKILSQMSKSSENVYPHVINEIERISEAASGNSKNAKAFLELMIALLKTQTVDNELLARFIGFCHSLFEKYPTDLYIIVLQFCAEALEKQFLCIQPILELDLIRRVFDYLQDDNFEDVLCALRYYYIVAMQDIGNEAYLPLIKHVFNETEMEQNIIPFTKELSYSEGTRSPGYKLLNRLLFISENLDIDMTQHIYGTIFIEIAYQSLQEECEYKNKENFLHLFSLLVKKSNSGCIYQNKERLIVPLQLLYKCGFSEETHSFILLQMTIDFLTKLKEFDEKSDAFISGSELPQLIHEFLDIEDIQNNEVLQGMFNQILQLLHLEA